MRTQEYKGCKTKLIGLGICALSNIFFMGYNGDEIKEGNWEVTEGYPEYIVW